MTETCYSGENGKQCEHVNICTDIHSNQICEDCGLLKNKDDFTFEKEWRYYGMMDTKHNSDPNRCHARKIEEKTIFKDVEKMGFSEKIIHEANVLYEQCTMGKIYRGNSRKGIIFACIFHAYKLNGYVQSCEHLLNVFQIDRKVGLKGLKFINLMAPKDAGFRKITVTIPVLIEEVMDKFHVTREQKKEAIGIYESLRNRSSLLNRSRPQSLASAIVWYYITQKNNGITMEYFLSRVNLSELTIVKLVHEIEHILCDPPQSTTTTDCVDERKKKDTREKE